jgi:diguanylate cyclase
MGTVTAAPPLPALSPAMAFDEAAGAVLTFLQDRLPLGAWAVTRVENGRQTYLHLDDRSHGLERGGSHAWQDSFCIRMVGGEGPRIAPEVARVPSYLGQPVAAALRIGAYVGVPIAERDGRLFGTLCGIDAAPQDAGLREEQGLIEVLGHRLETVLAADRDREAAARAELGDRLDMEADPLTGLYDRRAWDELISHEERRQRRFADPTAIAVVDLDPPTSGDDEDGDEADRHDRTGATALRAAVGDAAPIASFGRHAFVLLLRETSVQDAGDSVDTLYRSLARARVAGSIGWAPHTVTGGFSGAMDHADRRMCAARRQRRITRTTRPSPLCGDGRPSPHG